MPLTRPAALPDRTAIVRELTVREVRDWMTDLETRGESDALQAMALDACSLDDLAHMCDVPARDLEDYTPSELAPLIAVCQELNPHFFRVRAALSRVARMMLKEAEALVSTAPAASS